MAGNQTPALTRVVDGIEIPAAGTWRIDPGHTEVAFIGRHFMLTRVRGRFTGVDGAVVVGATPSQSVVEVAIDMASVESGDRARDEHLRSSDLFDVDQHPTATFRSTAVRWQGRSGHVDGELTVAGVTQSVALEVDYLGHVVDPWDGQRAVFSARTQINREDFGLTWNMALEAGGVVLSKEIQIEVEAELVLDA